MREDFDAEGQAGMDRIRKSGRRVTQYHSIVAHQTLVPSTTIVEFELEGEIQPRGDRYRIPFIPLSCRARATIRRFTQVIIFSRSATRVARSEALNLSTSGPSCSGSSMLC